MTYREIIQSYGVLKWEFKSLKSDKIAIYDVAKVLLRQVRPLKVIHGNSRLSRTLRLA